MTNRFARRAILAGTAGAALLFAAPAARALDADKARSLVERLVADITAAIDPDRSEQQTFGDFERIFATYGDVPTIARYSLGPIARSASDAQIGRYTDAFRTYIARKYGKRFREFIGGEVIVVGAKPFKSNFAVDATANLPGQGQLSVTFFVSDRSGMDLFYDIHAEGISLLRTERDEIGAMLDLRNGDLDAFIGDLAQAG